MDAWIILTLYAIIGALFQIVKKLEEKGRYAECITAGTVCGVLAGYLITDHKISTLILGGLIVGLLITGRLSNIGYYFGLASVLCMTFYYGAPPITLGILLIIAGATLVDEVLVMGESTGITGKILNFHPVINLVLVFYLILGIVQVLDITAFIVLEISYKLGAMTIEK